jgi:hypothetical protein
MPSTISRTLLPIALAALALAACDKKPAEEPASALQDPAAQQAEQESAVIQARQEELARREAELALREKEKELADREAALARANAPKPAPKRVAEKPKPPPGPRNYVVPTGTSLSVQLPAEISTKTAKVGQRLTGNLTNDIVVDGKVVARAGAPVQGSITQVISGSKTIGG